MSFDIETTRHLTDLYWFLVSLGGLIVLLVVAIALISRGGDGPVLVATGGVGVVFTLLIASQALVQDSLLPEPFSLVEYRAEPGAVTAAIEDRYEVTVLDVTHPALKDGA